MGKNELVESETIVPGTPWAYFCAEFSVLVEELDRKDEKVLKILNRIKCDFFSDDSAWRADFDAAKIDGMSFKKAVWESMIRADLRDVFIAFLSGYAESVDREFAFDVESERRVVDLSERIREKVLLRRELMPMEIHKYKEQPEMWLAWVTIAEKLMTRQLDLTRSERRMFAAGLTYYKDFLLSEPDLEIDYYFAPNGIPKKERRVKLDLENAIQCFFQDYDHNLEIDREIAEVEFFLDHLDLPDKYLSEAVDITCKVEGFYRDRFRKSDSNKYDEEREAAEFSHPLHVLRLCLGTVEKTRHYKDMIPPNAHKFWSYFDEPLHVLNLSIDAGGHDVPEDFKKLEIPDLRETLQSYLVRASKRLFPPEKQAPWVDERYDALEMLNAKKPRKLGEGQTPYSACILEILEKGGPARQLVKLSDDLHNGKSRIPVNYINGTDEASPKFVQKIKDKEPLIEKGLEVGFYWFVPVETLTRVFEANGNALLKHSHAWRTIYTNIYLPRKNGVDDL